MSRRLITKQSAASTTGTISAFTWGDDGFGASTSSTYTVTFSGGTGSGAQFTITRTNRIGGMYYVNNVTLSAGGTGYAVNDALTYVMPADGNTVYVTVTGIV